MRRAALVLVALALMLGGGGASMMPHDEWSQRPEIRALQQKLMEIREREESAVEFADQSQWRRRWVQEKLLAAEEAWKVADEARRLWRGPLLLHEEDLVPIDYEAMGVYLDAFPYAISCESGALYWGSDYSLQIGWEIGGGPKGVPSEPDALQKRLDELSRLLLEVRSEVGPGNVRPAPGVYHAPHRDELRWLAYDAHELARRARRAWAQTLPRHPQGFELYLRCAGLSLLADGYLAALYRYSMGPGDIGEGLGPTGMRGGPGMGRGMRGRGMGRGMRGGRARREAAPPFTTEEPGEIILTPQGAANARTGELLQPSGKEMR